jgi:hypothetical protein
MFKDVIIISASIQLEVLTCTITELKHHDVNTISGTRYIKSMRKAVFEITEVFS